MSSQSQKSGKAISPFLSDWITIMVVNEICLGRISIGDMGSLVFYLERFHCFQFSYRLWQGDLAVEDVYGDIVRVFQL